MLSAEKKNSKVIDTATLSSHCDACAKAKQSMSEEDFNQWRDVHTRAKKCEQNYVGPAGGMEAEGALQAFRRSEELHGLQYVELLGDGDSKAFASVSKDEVYGPNTDIKQER